MDQGRLLAGRYPVSPEELVAAGVTLFVDLTEEGELEPYVARLTGARHVRFPILDMWVTSDEQLVRTLDRIEKCLA